MRTKRWWLLAIAFLAAGIQTGRDAQTRSDEPEVWILVGVDGRAWLSTSAGLQAVPATTDAVAAGVVGTEALLVAGNRTARSWRVDSSHEPAPLEWDQDIRSLTCRSDECLAVTGTDHVAVWRGGDQLDPVDGLSDIAAVAIGERHAVALSHTGGLWAWGFNHEGQLGLADASEIDVPRRVMGIRGVASLGAGAHHSVATLQDGTVWAWGANEAGQLGLGDSRGRFEPTRVPGIERAVSVAARGDRTFVLTEAGELFAFGGGAVAPRRLKTPGELVRVDAIGGTVVGWRADGRAWDVMREAELRLAAARASAAPPPPAPEVSVGGTVAFLVGRGPLGASDRAVAARMEGLGLTVRVVEQDRDAVAALAGATVAVISASVETRALDGSALRALPVPVVTWERFLYATLGLTRDRLPSHSSPLEDHLSIIRPEHPIAEGVEGHTRVVRRASPLASGEVGGGAQVIASARLGAPAVFAFEAGAPIAAGVAPARRVGLFLPSGSEDRLDTSGWRLFDNALAWAAARPQAEGAAKPQPDVQQPPLVGSILMVVGASGGTCEAPILLPGDAVHKARIEALNFNVVLRRALASCLSSSNADGMVMVFVSHTANNGVVGATFRDVGVPVAIQTAGVVDQMGMVDSTLRGTCAGPLNATFILNPAHPIANGLSGFHTISGTAGAEEWGTPPATAALVSRCDANNAHNTGFTFNQGQQMYDPPGPQPPYVAQARRAFWSFYAPINQTYTQVGADLFDRMILWTTNTPNLPPVANAGPDNGATACEEEGCTTYILNGHVFDDGLPSATTTSMWPSSPGRARSPSTHPTSPVTGVRYDNTGQYVLELQASDGQFQDTDTVVVNVHAHGSNLPPVVDAGPSKLVELSTVATLLGTVTDDGLPNPPSALTLAWSKMSGPGTVNFGTPAAVSTTATFSVAGVYVLRLQASDSSLVAYDDVIVTVNQAALLVVGNTTLTPGEAYLRSRMEALGFPVVLRDDGAATNADATNKAFVWLSSTVDTRVIQVLSPFVTSNRPIVVQTPGYADDLGLIPSNAGGTIAGQTQLVITSAAHALAAGLQGTVTASTAATYASGQPAPAATKVARVVAHPEPNSTIFAYEQNALMSSGALALNRRLFFGPHADAMAAANASGKRLVDAAILWSGRTNAAPWVEAGPPILTSSLGPVALNGYVTDDGLPTPPTLTSSWTKVSGPGTVVFGNGNLPATTATFGLVGDYVLRLTSSDGAKAASDLKFVTVYPVGTNGAPSVSAGPDQTIRLPQVAALVGASSDDNLPGPLTYTWTKVFGPGTVGFSAPAALVTNATFSLDGVYVLRLTASDGALTATDDVQVTVQPTAAALMIVASEAGLTPAETRVRQELESLGITVTLRNHTIVGPNDLIKKVVTVISDSIPSGGLPVGFIPTLAASEVPLVLWERDLFDDLGMTGPTSNVHYGTSMGTDVTIASPGHPMAALLSGTQTVYSAVGALEWGVPGTNAIKAATLASDGTRATVFGYERGSLMVTGTPNSRRVGVFAGSAQLYTPSGAALLRAAVRWATQRPVVALLVVGNASLTPSDLAVKERIAAIGYGVVVKTGTAAVGGPLGDALGKAFVVISSSSNAGNKFLGAQTAVLTWDGAVMSAMSMASSTGSIASQTQVYIRNPLHPLAGGLSDFRTTTEPPPVSYTWGVPGAGAVGVADIPTDPAKKTIFGYEVGASLVSGTAVDRRAGLFLTPTVITQLTADGKTLLDAAIQWAASSDPDKDGLGTADEYRNGTNPNLADTNGDGVLDGASVDAGISPTSPDVDGDGVPNTVERAQGTNPFHRDTDGDGFNDSVIGDAVVDCFPLDPTRWLCPTAAPGDTTPPIITLKEPLDDDPPGGGANRTARETGLAGNDQGAAMTQRSDRSMKRTLPRIVTWALLPALVSAGVPVAVAAPVPPPPASGAAAPPAASIAPYRLVPPATPPALRPVFSEQPTPGEIAKARVFEEPLVAARATSFAENRALAAALLAYHDSAAKHDLGAFDVFLAAHPRSGWRVSILTNLGLVSHQTGYVSRAVRYHGEAWRLGRDATDAGTRALADRAFGELAWLRTGLGHQAELEALLAEVEDRDFSGPATERLAMARQSLWLMQNRPGEAFRCGPVALSRVLIALGHTPEDRVSHFEASSRGTSLSQIHRLAKSAGVPMRMAKRADASAALPTPAVVHFKTGHFAAVVERQGERYLVADPVFDTERWITKDALDEETSGYVLAQELPDGYTPVADDEAREVWGKSCPNLPDPTQQNCPTSGGNCNTSQCTMMAGYTFLTLLAALRIRDTPLTYTVPKGPPVNFTFTYNQKDIFQPAVFSYGNVGPKWTFDSISYIEDDPSATGTQTLRVYLRGGGMEVYPGFLAGTGEGTKSAPEFRSRAVLVRVSASPSLKYERRLPNGAVETFAQPESTGAFPRRVFLTEEKDPQNLKLTYVYNGQMQLEAIVDALGQVSTFSYSDPVTGRMTGITDPFGRTVSLTYDPQGRLNSITDAIGLTSSFVYGANDFITSMTTPYGTTRFTTGDNGNRNWIEAEDPLGARERLEYVRGHDGAIGPRTLPSDQVPTGFEPYNGNFDAAVTLYWDKRAMMLAPGQVSSAEMKHWLENPVTHQPRGIVRAHKKALESRIWYGYEGQSTSHGNDGRLVKAGRLLDDPDQTGPLTRPSQVWQFTRNQAGKVCSATDPRGRLTLYTYGTNNVPDSSCVAGASIDLLKVEQKHGLVGGPSDVVETSTYNSLHLPLTRTDGANQTTMLTYNAAGQLLTVTTPPRLNPSEQRTTTYTYQADTGYLMSVVAPGGVTTSYTYDAYGRVRTDTDNDNDTTTYDYDVFDRPTRTTFPDATYSEIVYERLDPLRTRDRLGRWTEASYDPLRRLVSTRDPANRAVTNEWCTCGSLSRVVDPNGNPTTWERDLQGRVTRETRADGSFKEYAYEGSAPRLKQTIDPKGQVTQYLYDVDDKLVYTHYAFEEHSTPDVTLDYLDPATGQPDAHGRLRSMADGTGTTTYSYIPFGQLGAGSLQTVDGPAAGDSITYSYEQLGRLASRVYSGVTNSWNYDQQGRLVSQGDPIGTFTYAYNGNTARLASLTYPNGQSSLYSYLTAADDRRLAQIRHQTSTSVVLNQLSYGYDDVGNVTYWQLEPPNPGSFNPGKTRTLEYDRADQLVAVDLQQGAFAGAASPLRNRYAYDAAGNRTAEEVDGVVTSATHDNMNKVLAQQPGGAVLFRGFTSEPARVTVQGQPATTTAGNQFSGNATVGAVTDVVVQARDYAVPPNTSQKTYHITQSGPSRSFTYDENGNMESRTDAGVTTTYEWDAEDRLLAVKRGAVTLATYTYDGEGRRRTKQAGGIGTTYIWDRQMVLEERSTFLPNRRHISGLALDQHLAHVENGNPTYYLSDHLGSIVRTTNASGATTLVRSYDPWGRPTEGASASGHAYTGREWDAQVGLYYYRARYYDPELGRFLSPDPLGSDSLPSQGHLVHVALERYAYALNSPAVHTDPLGLCPPGQEIDFDKIEVCGKLLKIKLDKIVRNHRIEMVACLAIFGLCMFSGNAPFCFAVFVVCVVASTSKQFSELKAAEQEYDVCLSTACKPVDPQGPC